MSDEAIPAATIILLRDAPRFEVLMVARHEDISFAGGAMVFPGGRVDPGDRDGVWRQHSTGLHDDREIAAAQVAAAREAFEEVGVLFARDAHGDFISGARTAALTDMRSIIEANDAEFLAMIRRERVTLACDAMHMFSHWVAPPGMHKRFNTLFFAARFPAGQAVLEDGNEATESVWIEPREAINARERGERKIIFPTARNLDLLGVSSRVDEVFEFAARRPIRPITPKVAVRDGEKLLTIPADMGYPVVEEP
ncbi:MAG: NUDIX domain-containing protein, partial [Parvularculaceae bacterium]|nr:NUDIX domain-containing protein [Parvularculaceae bacterium]